MTTKSKSKRGKHSRPLSQKPAAVKLRELRKNRSAQERLIEKINSQRRSAVRRARAIIENTAWSILEEAEQRAVRDAIEAKLRHTYDAAAVTGNDNLVTAEEVDKSITKTFEEHAKFFVFGGEDEPLPFELFEARKCASNN
ncbi:hypothetical protein PFICI_15181 [Pestalotiopsis fici W106-1]|uniref:Uncharacterized protein n=1 Tax=Pestalotiopsis fici (strain W106-1 / CGMCC3.15140) TaxID=1229662 RepID=W3WJM2_PESFW|nr:uncharacterized protein PFICI_15181 [Pestalotiopsis fici W106-1]ETS73006.1 hypothetical protein PFICI_15181 [Pestalotiopsis fici W106-1]